jgi:hypothetical protein
MRTVTLASMLDVARRYRRFPLFASWSGLLSSAAAQMPTLLLAAHYGVEVTGLFALANRLQAVTITLVSAAIGDVFLGEAARLLKDQPERIRSLFWRTLRRSLLVGLVLTLMITLPAPFVFGHVFGEEWAEAGTYIQILAPMFVLSFSSRAVASSFDVLERQDLDLVTETVWLAATIAAFMGGHALGLSATGTVALYSAAGSLCAITGMFLAWVCVRRPFRSSPLGEDGALARVTRQTANGEGAGFAGEASARRTESRTAEADPQVETFVGPAHITEVERVEAAPAADPARSDEASTPAHETTSRPSQSAAQAARLSLGETATAADTEPVEALPAAEHPPGDGARVSHVPPEEPEERAPEAADAAVDVAGGLATFGGALFGARTTR